MKVCKVCGKSYKRTYCEYCMREKKWNDSILEIRMEKHLTPRIINDLQNIAFPKLSEVKSCFIFGKVVTGKTLKAVNLFLFQQKNDYIDNIFGTYKFITVPNLLMEIKSIYDSKESTEMELINHYINLSLLVLDDFGVEKATDWSFQILYMIINGRYEQMKKTIFTSNKSLTELAVKLQDERLLSRIAQMCEVINKVKNYR